MIEDLVLQRYTTPSVVVDQGLGILYLFGPTDPYLSRPPGEARLDLLSWVKPELYAKLRVGLAEAIERRRPVTLTGLRLEGPAEATRVEIVIGPIAPGLHEAGMLLVTFRDVSRPATAPSGPGEAPEEADEEDEEEGEEEGDLSRQIYQELQDTREHLRTSVDQLRTATEEHSTSYEELLSLNEELKSSNEELEASQEELQSLNPPSDESA